MRDALVPLMPRLDMLHAGLMHRQAQGLHERLDLAPAAELRRRQCIVLHRHLDQIERRQAGRKKLAKDHAIMQASQRGTATPPTCAAGSCRPVARYSTESRGCGCAPAPSRWFCYRRGGACGSRFEHKISAVRDMAASCAVVMHARENSTSMKLSFTGETKVSARECASRIR